MVKDLLKLSGNLIITEISWNTSRNSIFGWARKYNKNECLFDFVTSAFDYGWNEETEIMHKNNIIIWLLQASLNGSFSLWEMSFGDFMLFFILWKFSSHSQRRRWRFVSCEGLCMMGLKIITIKLKENWDFGLNWKLQVMPMQNCVQQ